MAELIVIGLKGIHRAAEVLDQIESLNLDGMIDLGDAVTVYRTGKGKLRVDGAYEPTRKEGRVLGGLMGAVLGAAIAAPVTLGTSTAGAAAAVVGLGAAAFGTTGAVIGDEEAKSWKEDYGIPDEFVQEVSGMVQPGQSAVFVLASTSDPTAVAELFRGYGGKILRTTLDPTKARKLQQVLEVRAGADV